MTTEVATAAALDAMFGRPDGGFHDGTVSREKSARVKYWRKPESGATDSGWILLGPDMLTDMSKYQTFLNTKRFKELPDSFGKEVAGTPTSKIRPQHRYEQGEEHRWLETFLTSGGLTYIIKPGDPFGTAGEYLIPASQLVALNLHRRPGMKEARPDLAVAVDVKCPYECTAKDGRGPRLFSGLTEEFAQQSADQHVMSVHKETIASRAVGNEIAKALGTGSKVDADMIATIVAAVAAAMQGNAPQAVPSAAVAEEWVEPEPVAELPVPEPVYDPSPRFDIDTATRREMMSFAKTMGIQTLPFKATADVWREYLKEQFAPAA